MTERDWHKEWNKAVDAHKETARVLKCIEATAGAIRRGLIKDVDQAIAEIEAAAKNRLDQIGRP